MQPKISEPLTTPSFNFLDFHPHSDGRTDTTAQFQQALDHCAAQGGGAGGRLRIPAGTYLTGSLLIGPRTTLHLEKGACIRGSENLDQYPLIAARWEGDQAPVHRGLLCAIQANQIAITGQGSIEGNPVAGKARPRGFNTSGIEGTRTNARGPCALEFIDCTDVRIEGITLKQGNMWTAHPLNCQDVLFRDVTLETTGLNSDGIDVDSSQRVWIDRCSFANGDDAIALKSGKGDHGRSARPTEDVLITDCVFHTNDFAAIALGSECSGGIRRVRIERCSFAQGMRWGIRFKTAKGRGGFIEEVHAREISSGARTFFQLLMDVNNPDPQPVAGAAGVTRMGGIVFEEITVSGGMLLDVVGSPLVPLAGLKVHRVKGTCDGGMIICHARGVDLKEVQVKGYSGERLSTFDVSGVGLAGADALGGVPKSVEPGVDGNPPMPPVH